MTDIPALGFLDRIPGGRTGLPVETWVDLVAAAEARIEDAERLAAGYQPRTTAAIYLGGYAAEMMLKVALYRATNVPQSQDLNQPLASGRSHRRAAESKVKAGGGRNYHDIELLLTTLMAVRRSEGNPIDPIFSGLVGHQVSIIARSWNEAIRYRPEHASPAEMLDVIGAIRVIYKWRNQL